MNTYKEKSEFLVKEMTNKIRDMFLESQYSKEFIKNAAKSCAIVAVDEIISEIECIDDLYSPQFSEEHSFGSYIQYWSRVREEILKL